MNTWERDRFRSTSNQAQEGVEDKPFVENLKSKPTIEPDLLKAGTMAPTPSITVGTQVRLTGVVSEFRGSEVVVNVGDGRMNTSICLNPHYLEVIRRPFKRGEIIYHVGDKDSEPRTVVIDEAEGFVLLARHVHGTEVLEWDATSYERRP